MFENIIKFETRTSVYTFHMKILVCLDPNDPIIKKSNNFFTGEDIPRLKIEVFFYCKLCTHTMTKNP